MFVGDPRYGGFPTILFLLVIAWSMVWKGLALWRAARNNQRYWFIAMLVVSSVGILEIIYIKFFQKKIPLVTTTSKTTSKRKSK
ncbi:hypothetical protein A2715_05950 [Candidatus Woesebacteria bacterium RIFCSPHIGHO2_01_FULL_39_32]|uniref:DUF5652 domain-containing protein n=2 Tax=Candidatus Woeseibacteriota TaxID=1752722 RepID=A0A0G0PRH3_9BACT|nr:MAG: hypothetical protein UT61_C0005G0014 [Candidatus Woesebacteria bacterium GW2011_GWA1_39_8]OGM25602.1 MAG: hypothetical protein A2715_05950 [Candidatus Woesebacteria bacterium RIFCSPHIGHO2_01_FULL_39_32]OGM36875.1 MAG: hypothetical protein A3F01_00425 [Candidatus Woesebacteria bacterium RIFCSPHIGHO2_12_FULL_38_11]OGM65137.1 MAG: hypothetical protein A2893_05560 [Candidatus Woesebacteria bacterium RIFCSPLOWO2_01_FULL_39_25]